jgi:hypothetical protein
LAGLYLEVAMGELVQVGAYAGLFCGLAVAARATTHLIVVIWSLRADEAGRKHARALLRILNPRGR